jgi:hypothetical protein
MATTHSDSDQSDESPLLSQPTKIGASRYRLLGASLVVAGLCLTPVAYVVIEAIPLAALGLSMIILGTVCLALDVASPKVPAGVSMILMEAGVENLAVLIEELGLRSRGIYLPSSSVAHQKAQALIPLRPNGARLTFGSPISQRLIVKYGPEESDVGLLVSTPGSAAVEMLDSKPGASSSEMSMTLTSLIVGAIDAADSVNVFTDSEKVTVEVSGSRFRTKNTRLQDCLGSPLASIAASVASEALDKPVLIEGEESRRRGKYVVQLRVMGESLQ